MRLPLLSLAILLSACMPPTLKTGMDMAEQGDFEGAARYFMQCLDDDAYDEIAAKGLDRVARDSFEVKLDIAREAEADGRYADSLAAFDDADAWLAVLKEYDAVGWNPGDALTVEREEVKDRLALKHYVDAKDEVAGGKFEQGIASYEEALAVRPGFQDTETQLTDAYYAWGRAEVTAGHYRKAADAFAKAVERGKGHEAIAWGSAVSAALGRYYLKTGHCRHAALELRRVDRGAIHDTELNAEAERAEACARVELVVENFDEVAGESISGTSLGAVVSDRVVHELSERGSEFVKLLDTEAARAFTAPDAEPRPGHIYVIRGKVSQYRMERSEPKSVTKSEVAHKRELCPPPDGPYYDMEDEWCDDPFTLLWDETREGVKWRIAGNVRVTDPRSAEQILSKPLELSEHSERITREGLRREDGVDGPIVLVVDREEGKFAVPQTMIDALAEKPEPLPNDGELALAAAHRLAEEAATQVLATVDRPPLPPVPGRLEIQAPVTDASELKFGTPNTPDTEPKGFEPEN
ncbi:MAG: hypothetical protein EP330_20520 [Deltaproteobacteria bacterium]|nr:MAG: hypothetical protein EP330_20520 [Deltaproteobacteria bacterium]